MLHDIDCTLFFECRANNYLDTWKKIISLQEVLLMFFSHLQSHGLLLTGDFLFFLRKVSLVQPYTAVNKAKRAEEGHSSFRWVKEGQAA